LEHGRPRQGEKGFRGHGKKKNARQGLPAKRQRRRKKSSNEGIGERDKEKGASPPYAKRRSEGGKCEAVLQKKTEEKTLYWKERELKGGREYNRPPCGGGSV